MRILSLSVDLKLSLDGNLKLEILKSKPYVFAEAFVEELCTVYNPQIIESEFNFSDFYTPYLGQDLTNKTLFCFRTAGIGDLMAMLVPIRILKEKYPTVKVIAASSGIYRDLFVNDSCIDEFLQIPFPASYLAESDYSLYFQGIVESNPKARSINIYDLFLDAFFISYNDLNVEKKIPILYINEDVDTEVTDVFKNIKSNKPIAGIQLKTSTIVRDYPYEYFKELIARLHSCEIDVVLIGEPNLSNEIVKKYNLCDKNMATDLTNVCVDLNHLVSVINHCDFLIGPDTSGLHIAGALKKPMVGLFGPIPSSLRIGYFKNAIGIDCKTRCGPCFLHGNRPCRFSVNNGQSTCMYLAEPKKIVEIVKENILPLFGIRQAKVASSEPQDIAKNEKRALVTLAIGEQATDMLRVARPGFELYAKKVGADFIVIDQEKINGMFPNIEKFQIKQLLEIYDRIMYVDVDILIHPDCEDLFEIVPKNKVGVLPDCADAKWGNLNRYREITAIQHALGDINWTSGYFNSGVMIFSKMHAGLFDNPELREKIDSGFRDQTLLNYNFFKNNYELFILDKKYNGMEIVGYSSRYNVPNKTNAMIMHFAHEGEKLVQMKKTASLIKEFNFSEDIDDRPLLFYDYGELGWSMYLAAHIKYLTDDGVKDIKICTTKNRFVLYNTLPVQLFDIPNEIREKTQGLDKDGTHLFNHATGERVKHDVLSFLFQHSFPEYKVVSSYGNFLGERTFCPYAASDEASEIAKNLFGNAKLLLLFPRFRGKGKFSKRDLPLDFYLALLKELSEVYKDYSIVSVGIMNGSYELGQHVAYSNFVDLVAYDDEKMLDILIALCKENAVLAIGSQSSLPKISLLCGVPTYIIGHEEDRHISLENWRNIPAGFYKVPMMDDKYELTDYGDCIGKIIEFSKVYIESPVRDLPG